MQIGITVWSSMQCMVCCMSWVILVMWFCILCAKKHVVEYNVRACAFSERYNGDYWH